MSWEQSFAVRGDLRRFTEANQRALAAAHTTVIRRKATILKNALRRHAKQVGLGGLALAIRSETVPARGAALAIRGRVYSKALVKGRPGGLTDLLTVFQTGAIVRAPGGHALAVPTPEAGRGKGRRKSPVPSDFPHGALRMIAPAWSRVARLVFADRPNVVAFWLVKQVTVPRRLTFDPIVAQVLRDIPEQIAREHERRLNRAGFATVGTD